MHSLRSWITRRCGFVQCEFKQKYVGACTCARITVGGLLSPQCTHFVRGSPAGAVGGLLTSQCTLFVRGSPAYPIHSLRSWVTRRCGFVQCEFKQKYVGACTCARITVGGLLSPQCTHFVRGSPAYPIHSLRSRGTLGAGACTCARITVGGLLLSQCTHFVRGSPAGAGSYSLSLNKNTVGACTCARITVGWLLSPQCTHFVRGSPAGA
eukprot:gene10257-biopygen22797